MGIKKSKNYKYCRNPIDVVNSWFNSDLDGSRKSIIVSNTINFLQKKIKPFYYYKSINKNKLNKYEAAVEMVCECIENEIKNLKKIKNIKNLIRIDFDNFAENTNYNLKDL